MPFGQVLRSGMSVISTTQAPGRSVPPASQAGDYTFFGIFRTAWWRESVMVTPGVRQPPAPAGEPVAGAIALQMLFAGVQSNYTKPTADRGPRHPSRNLLNHGLADEQGTAT
jgi:hypothetical protein